MSVASPYSGVTARDNAPFVFKKNGSLEFYPGAGSTLRFASKDVDVLSLVDMPCGFLVPGDTVGVWHLGTRVFTGSVAAIVQNAARGDDVRETVTVQGPWGALQRLMFRQTWNLATGSSSLSYATPHVVLNQAADGTDQDLQTTIREIASFAAQKCGFSYSSANISVAAIQLPKDEAHDITCADAISRVLRFFPRKIVRFDYSSATPGILIQDPSGASDAGYVATIPKSSRRKERNAHPITAVDIYTDAVDVSVGGESVTRNHQVYPANADITGIDVLHAYIPISPGSSSISYEKLEVDTEEIGHVNGVANERLWWKTKHPRLANVPIDALTISEFGYTFPSFSPRRITNCTVGALERFGCQAELVRFHCKAKIEGVDEVEEDIYLTMDFVVTNASTRTYTQQAGSSWEAGETLPEGLAQAIYEDRCGELVNEYMTVRLGNTLPVLGDRADGLVLQEFTIDLDDLTAELHFGQPEFLSFEDMRSLLNAFRQKAYANASALRATGEPDEDDAVDFGGVQPVSSTEFCPGTKAKTTIKSTAGGSGSISLAAADLDSHETAAVHTLTYKDGDDTAEVKIIATADIHLDGTGEEEDDDYCNNISQDGLGPSSGDGNDISGDGDNDISRNPCK